MKSVAEVSKEAKTTISLHLHFGLNQECASEIIYLIISTYLLYSHGSVIQGSKIGYLSDDTKPEDAHLAYVWYNPTTNNHSALRSRLGPVWSNPLWMCTMWVFGSHLLTVSFGSTKLQIQSYQPILPASASPSKEWFWNITQGKGKPNINRGAKEKDQLSPCMYTCILLDNA